MYQPFVHFLQEAVLHEQLALGPAEIAAADGDKVAVLERAEHVERVRELLLVFCL